MCLGVFIHYCLCLTASSAAATSSKFEARQCVPACIMGDMMCPALACDYKSTLWRLAATVATDVTSSAGGAMPEPFRLHFVNNKRTFIHTFNMGGGSLVSACFVLFSTLLHPES